MAAQNSLKTTDNSNSTCCYWMQNSEACSTIKTGGATIVEALVAIAFLTGCLMVAAQMGLDLRGINAVAQWVQPIYLYTAIATTLVVGLVNTVFIIALVRSQLNKTYSQADFEKLGLEAEIAAEASEKTFAGSYWTIHKPRVISTEESEGSPEAFAVYTVDGNNRPFLQAFKLVEDYRAYVTGLVNNGYCDAQKAWEGPVFPTEYIESKFLGLEEHVEPLAAELTNGYYRSRECEIPGTGENMILLVVRNNDVIESHYCKVGHDHKVLSNYPGFIDEDLFQKRLQIARNEYILSPLEDGEYWDIHVEANGQVLYVVAYNEDSELDYFRCRKPSECTAFMKELAGRGMTDGREAYSSRPTYRESELRRLNMDPNERKKADLVFSTNSIQEGVYYAHTIPSLTEGQAPVYALKIATREQQSGPTYYKEEYKNAYDNKIGSLNTNGFLNIAQLEQEIKQQIEALKLDFRCRKPKDYYPFETSSRFVIVFRGDDDHLYYEHWKTAEERQETLHNDAKFAGFHDLKAEEESQERLDPDLVRALFGERYEKEVIRTTRPNEFYIHEELSLPPHNKPFYAVVCGDGEAYFYYDRAKRDEFIQTFLVETKKYYCRNTLMACVYRGENALVKQNRFNETITEVGVYVRTTDPYKVDGQEFHVLAWTVKDDDGKLSIYHKPFASENELTDYLASPDCKDFVPYLFSAEQADKVNEIAKQEIEKLRSEFEKSANIKSEYTTLAVPTEDGQVLHALIYNVPGEQVEKGVMGTVLSYIPLNLVSTAPVRNPGEGRVLYFGSQETLLAYVKLALPNYVDSKVVYFATYGSPPGMQAAPGAVEQFSLNQLLVFPGDAFTYHVNVQGNPIPVLITRQSDGTFRFGPFGNDEDMHRFIEMPENKLRDLTAEISGMDIQTLKNVSGEQAKVNRVDLLVTKQHEFWTETLKEYTLIFYRDGQELTSRVFKSTALDEFKKIQNLVVDVKASLAQNDEYPLEYGLALAAETAFNPEFLQAWSTMCRLGEYMSFDQPATDKVFPLVTIDAYGVYVPRFFKTEDARLKAVEELKGLGHQMGKKDEYPTKIGVELLKTTNWSMAQLQGYEHQSFNKEFIFFQMSNPDTCKCWPFLIKDEHGSISYRYFATKEAREAVYNELSKHHGYGNASTRHNNTKDYVKIAGAVRLAEAVDKKSYYYASLSPDSQEALLITYSAAAIVPKYMKATELDERVRALGDGYVELKELEGVISDKEFALLEPHFADSQKYWITEGKLKPKEYVIRERLGRYVAIFVNHEDKTDLVVYYRKGDPEIDRHIASLVDAEKKPYTQRQ